MLLLLEFLLILLAESLAEMIGKLLHDDVSLTVHASLGLIAAEIIVVVELVKFKLILTKLTEHWLLCAGLFMRRNSGWLILICFAVFALDLLKLVKM